MSQKIIDRIDEAFKEQAATPPQMLIHDSVPPRQLHAEVHEIV
jgi:hypothetical protein